MLKRAHKSLRAIAIACASVVGISASAQCPTLFDYYGDPSPAPQWFHCASSNFTLVLASPQTVGNYSIDWGDGSPLQFGAGLAPPQSVTHLYPLAVATYTVTFTELSTGCVVVGTLVMEQSTSASIQIPVGGLTQVCAPYPLDFINSSTNVSPSTVFVWDFGDGSPSLTFDHTNSGQTVTHTYERNTVDCETTVRLSARNQCNDLQGGASVATFNPIRIWDLDDAAITPSATLLCWPDRSVTYQNTTQRNCFAQGNIFQRYEYWNFGDYWGTGQDSILDWSPWPPSFPRTIEYPAIGTYEVMMLDSNYCGIDTAYMTIEIVPAPSVTLVADPTLICAGETVSFTQTTDGGANYYQWNFGEGAGFGWTAAGNQTHTFNTPGNYTVSYTASIQGATAGCADTASVVIEVLPRPTASFTLDQNAACDSILVTVTNTSTSAVSHLWDFGDGTTSDLADPPPHFYGSAGSYVISLTVTNSLGCEHSSTRTVNVYEPPTVTISVQNLCLGSVAQFTANVTTAPGNAVNAWLWDLGNGTTSTAQSPTHQYATAGPYVVTVQVNTPYCGNTGTQWVNVQQSPTAIIDAVPALGCSPLSVSFNNSSTGASTYSWDLGDGVITTDDSPTHVYINTGTTDIIRTVQLTATSAFGCSDVTTTQVIVAPGISAGFVHNGIPGCAPFEVDFTNTSGGSGSYTWDFGDGTTSTEVSPTHTFVNTTYALQIRTVTLTANSPAGCSATATQQIMVYPTPDFTFVAEPDSGCSPLAVTFPSVVGAVSYTWDFGDGTTGSGPSPTHIYVNTSPDVLIYTVDLFGSNAFGCVDSAQAIVQVFPSPVAQFTADAQAGCHPFTTQLVDQSIGAATYQWSYGDGQSSTTDAGQHDHSWNNFAGPGAISYNVSLTVATAQGCTSSAFTTVEVYPAVTAAFVAPDTGCAPLAVPFNNISTGADSYAWSFGDGQGSTATAPSHTYFNQGLADASFTAQLIATSSFGCSSTTSAPILVYPQPLAQFLSSVEQGCQPLVVPFQDLSIGASSLQWNFGDGTTLNTAPSNTTHTYNHGSPTTVVFEPTLVATSVHGCTDTTHKQVQVFPLVTAEFTVDTAACSPFEITLTNTGTGGSSYTWDLGDGNIMVGDPSSYTYVNTTGVPVQRTITLTATSPFGCTAVSSRTITVYPTPTAAFMATPFSQLYPDATVSVTNTTAPGNWQYHWDFGDGTTSTLQHPAPHVYATWGDHTITLVVSNAYCSATVSQDVVIVPPLPTANFTGQGKGCAALTVAFTNTSWQAQSYLWHFGDGSTSTADNPTYTYNQPGTYSVSLTAYGMGGNSSTLVKVDSIVVHPRANAFFVLQPAEVVVPTQPLFTYNLSSNAGIYAWDFGDGSTSTELNPVHFYTTDGTYGVQLIANNQWNCPDTFRLEDAVTAKVSGDIAFPNAFTPGNSGPTGGVYDPRSFDNDVFYPIAEGVEDYKLEVFNRWGELLFVSNDVKVGWDGYYRDRPAKQDVYVWKAYAKFSDGRETVLKGDVTLLR